MRGEIYLEIKIDRSEPIDLLELTEGLYALAAFYKRFARNEEGEGETLLLVESISEGSIVAKLITFLDQIPMFEESKLLRFAQKLDFIIDFFREGERIDDGQPKVDDEQSKNERLNYQNTSQVLSLTSGDRNGSITIKAHKGASVVVNIGVDSNAANAIQNRIKNYVDAMQEPIVGLQEKETFHWFQARDASTATGDKGVIERISERPLPVVFKDDSMKDDMLDDPLFTQGYIVDVEVGFIENQPASYKIIRVHQAIDRQSLTQLKPDDEDPEKS